MLPMDLRNVLKNLRFKNQDWRTIRCSLIIFIISLISVLLLSNTPFFKHLIIRMLAGHIVRMVHFVLASFGFDVTIYHTILLYNDFGIDIQPACTGVVPAAIFISAVVAFPSKIVQKIIVIIFALPGIHVFNIVRISLLFVLGIYKTEWFDFLHRYVGQTVFILFTLFLWFYLMDKIVSSKAIERSE